MTNSSGIKIISYKLQSLLSELNKQECVLVKWNIELLFFEAGLPWAVATENKSHSRKQQYVAGSVFTSWVCVGAIMARGGHTYSGNYHRHGFDFISCVVYFVTKIQDAVVKHEHERWVWCTYYCVTTTAYLCGNDADDWVVCCDLATRWALSFCVRKTAKTKPHQPAIKNDKIRDKHGVSCSLCIVFTLWLLSKAFITQQYRE